MSFATVQFFVFIPGDVINYQLSAWQSSIIGEHRNGYIFATMHPIDVTMIDSLLAAWVIYAAVLEFKYFGNQQKTIYNTICFWLWSEQRV